MQMTIFSADCVGNAANCSYPNKVEVKCPKDMEIAVARDHVCATYTNNYRNEQNFLESDVIPMDIDNDHSEDPKDWITEEKMKEMFGSIDFILVPSRHHMVAKDGKPARPKYHVYFPVSAIADRNSIQAFTQLASRMNSISMEQGTMRMKQADAENEKFSFRIWLLGLGMKGEEYKTARRILLAPLKGNTAFRTDEIRERFRARQRAKRESERRRS